MPTSVSDLKAKARELLPPEIAPFVESAIDADAAQEARLPRTSCPPEAEPESIATAFLGDALFEKLGSGRFLGRPIVQWNGMDSFIYLQDKVQTFSYTTASGRLIQPRSISTDGGSTPRILHALRKFSPWGYGPSFIIHDWLFAAHRHELAPDADWAFEDTATVLAESMKSLMVDGFVDADSRRTRLEKAEDTLYLIYQAVRSTFALNIWDQR